MPQCGIHVRRDFDSHAFNLSLIHTYLRHIDTRCISAKHLRRGLSQIVPGARTASKNYYLSHIILLTVWAPGTICESPFSKDTECKQ